MECEEKSYMYAIECVSDCLLALLFDQQEINPEILLREYVQKSVCFRLL